MYEYIYMYILYIKYNPRLPGGSMKQTHLQHVRYPPRFGASHRMPKGEGTTNADSVFTCRTSQSIRDAVPGENLHLLWVGADIIVIDI